ncbi:MAG: TIGR02587 family membrane protein [Herpetosiphonaceae bacterium]|nr:TIGR02587 family membrane protein [Herpetosiphonaceae bacterium]
MNHSATRPSIWAEELDDLLRAVSGAFLFGVPLLYTMEVWWIGTYVSPLRMLLGLLLTYAALVALNRTAGFRAQKQTSIWRSLTDSAEGLAIGLLISIISLLLLRRLTFDLGLDTLMGQIVLESVPFSIGVGIANGLLNRGGDDGNDGDAGPGEQDGPDQPAADPSAAPRSLWRDTLADAGATALGAIIIAFSIAPTDEVPMIAGSLSPPVLLLLVAASLVISYIIVFEAEFGAQEKRRSQRGIFQHPLSETVASYLISLLLTALMLLFFQQLDFSAPLNQWVSYTITLGLPATIGGAAGRLAL